MIPLYKHWVARAGLALGLLVLMPFAAGAQSTWPAKPVRLVVPYPPGGIADAFARVLAEALAERLKQPIIIDNKPGGSLIIGTDHVAKSPADGYTLLMASTSSLAINPTAFKSLPYDPIKDFVPISMAFRTPLLLMVASSTPVSNVSELVAFGKKNPGKLSFASLGHGSTLHIAGERFASLAGIDLIHVPYKGASTAIPDLLTGRVSMMFDGGAMVNQARDGKVKLLAVTGRNRVPGLPDIPTMQEAGVQGYDLDLWFGIVAPSGTPPAIVERLSKDIADIEKQPSFKSRLAAYSHIDFQTSTSAEFSETIRRDQRMWGGLLREYQVEPQ